MRRFFLWGIIFILSQVVSPLNAKVFTFTERNCQCELPDTWIDANAPGALVSVVDTPHQRFFEMTAMPTPRTVTLDNPEFLRGFDKGSISHGFTIKDHREVILNGVKFYEVVLTKDLGNKTLNACHYIALADGYGYNIRIEAYDTDPDQDGELKAMVQSFAFIKPPQTHKAFSYRDIFSPADASQHSVAYVVNRLAGMAMALIAVLSLILSIVVGITYAIQAHKNKDDESEEDAPVAAPLPELPAIHVLLNDGRQGVYRESQVRNLLQNRTLTLESFFWLEGMPEWKPLRELPSLHKKSRASAETDEDEPPYRFQFIHKIRFLRMAAVWIDMALIFGPAALIFLIRSVLPAAAPGETRPYFALFACFGFYLIGLLITQIVQVFRSRSVGKSIFRLRVINFASESKSGFLANVIRLLTHGVFGLIPIGIFFGLPPVANLVIVLYAFIDALLIFYHDRCIHDYLTGTAVIQRESSWNSRRR